MHAVQTMTHMPAPRKSDDIHSWGPGGPQLVADFPEAWSTLGAAYSRALGYTGSHLADAARGVSCRWGRGAFVVSGDERDLRELEG